jgi:hypothetical protein
MKRASSTTGKSRTIQKNARTIDNTCVCGLLVGEDSPTRCVRVELEDRWIDHRRKRADHSRLIASIEFRPHRTTTLLQIFRGFIVNPKASSTPDAGPVRGQEIRVKGPRHLTIDDDGIRRLIARKWWECHSERVPRLS